MKLIEIKPNSERWLDLRDLPNEEWKDIKNFEGLYQISNYGRVKSLKRTTTKEHIMKISYTKRGYCRINLYNIRYGTGIERSKVKKYKPVLQYSLSDDFIKEYKSIQDASISVTNKHNKNGVHRISDCAKGYIDSYMGFKWKFKECEETE